MINKVKKFLNKYNLKDKNVVIAFSAGPDSCALALLLDKLKNEYNFNIALAYFNHNWRVDEALEEENFTKEFAEKHNFSFFSEKADLNEAKTEENARKLRYDFLKRCAAKFNSNTVFLAHNKNDNVETLIYRVIKGTAIDGLCSIPEHRDIYFRPLLNSSKDEILNFLKSENQIYKLDSSNEDIKYKRNLIRKEILPLFDKINPNYLNNIETLIKNSIASKKIIDNSLAEIKKKLFKNNKIRYSEFISLDSAYRYEILNDYLGTYLKHRNYSNILKFDEFIMNNTASQISVNADLFLKVKNNEIYLEKICEKNPLQIEINSCGEYLFEDIILKIEKVTKEDKIFPSDNDSFCFLDFDFPLTLRHRKCGDIFSPFGLDGKMKLKDYLINQKIEQSKKDKLILLCKNSEICWILGKKISEKYKIKDKECYKASWRKNG